MQSILYRGTATQNKSINWRSIINTYCIQIRAFALYEIENCWNLNDIADIRKRSLVCDRSKINGDNEHDNDHDFKRRNHIYNYIESENHHDLNHIPKPRFQQQHDNDNQKNTMRTKKMRKKIKVMKRKHRKKLLGGN